MGNTGYVSRVKGKSTADLFQAGLLGGVRQAVNSVTSAKTLAASTTIPNNGHTIVSATLGAGKLVLDGPVAGVEKTITVTTMSSAHVCVATNSTGVVFLDGVNTFWNVSTAAGTQVSISLMGVSTSAWAFLGVTPSTLANGLANTS